MNRAWLIVCATLACSSEPTATTDARSDSRDSTDVVDASASDSVEIRDAQDALVPDSLRADVAADATCLGMPFVFTRPEPFVPTVAVPILRVDIPITPVVTYGRIDVDLDFLRGAWAMPAPATGGIHNIFWLHRGVRGGNWLDNVVMYMNVIGRRAFRLSSNLGITDRAIWSQNIEDGFPSVEGQRYHVETMYDAAGQRRSFRVTQGSSVIANAQDVPVVASIPSRSPYPGGQSAFFLEIGVGAWDPAGGPEVPTYGWEYSNVVIRFHPVAPCP